MITQLSQGISAVPGGAVLLGPRAAGATTSPYLRDVLSVMDFGAKGDGTTDDTAAIQTAINAASTLAGSNNIVSLQLPPGFGFLTRALVPQNGVRLWAYGAYIKPDFANIGDFAFLSPAASLLNRFEMYGGIWDGSSSTTVNQQFFHNTSGGSGQDILFKDMYLHDFASGIFYIRNTTRARVLDNTLVNVNNGALASWFNSINFVGDTTAAQTLQHLIAKGNIVGGSKGAGIAIVTAQTGTIDLKALIQGNITFGDAGGGGNSIAGGIDLESSASAQTYLGVTIQGNDVQSFLPDSSPNAAINISQTEFQQISVTDNRIQSSTAAFRSLTGDVLFARNRIAAGATPYRLGGGAITTDNQLTAGPIAGRAVLVAGTVTVTTPEVRANDNIVLTNVHLGGTVGQLSVGTIVAGTSFVINSSNAADTSTIYWRIDH